MRAPRRIVKFSDDRLRRDEELVTREWLVTAGNGSYACGSLGFVPTRRHHGLLVANLPAPQGRMLSLVQLREEILDADGGSLAKLWGTESVSHGLAIHGSDALEGFQLDCGFPVWKYRVDGVELEKAMVMPHGSTTVGIRYRVASGGRKLLLRLRPMIQFRGHNQSVATECEAKWNPIDESSHEFVDPVSDNRLRIKSSGCVSTFKHDPITEADCFYRIENARGYDHVGILHSDGYLEIEIEQSTEFTVFASMDSWKLVDQLARKPVFADERSRRESLFSCVDNLSPVGVEAELVLAADQFLMTPAKRHADQPDADPTTPEPERQSVIAGYPWFTDWGRDTMISLPGLTLASGRPENARQILLTFADYVRDGLIPNLFPEGGQDGMYHTADATLWFFQAIAEYESATGDDGFVQQMLPKLTEIIEAHLGGTLFGIHVDPADGLLVQGQDGVQLTWMDAKAGDWVVTPRRGKVVEINALWYNALKLHCQWSERFDPTCEIDWLLSRADEARRSFNERFWSGEIGYLLDVVDGEDGDDDSLRPNQLFAISLNHPVLQQDRWAAVLQVCIDHLLTPVGLRSLAMTSPSYIGTYHGDVYKRDAAYHQGTVWSWLIGPLVKAWCRAYPERTEVATGWLTGLEDHLSEACIGQISEIFEGDAPHEPKGCFAQAWGVAELLEAKRILSTEGSDRYREHRTRSDQDP